MRVVTYNIQYGRGRDGRFDLERIVAAVQGADIIALQEVERFWERSGNVDQAAAIAALLPDYWWVYGPSIDILKQLRPGPAGAVRRQFGNMVLARFPILASRNVILPRRSVQGRRTIQRAAIETTLELPGAKLVRVTSTHLCHLSGVVRLEQVRALLEMHRRAPLEGGCEDGVHPDPAWNEAIGAPAPPVDAILMGDFNMEPSFPEYGEIAGEPHPRLGRLALLDGFADAWTITGNAEEEGASWYLDWASRRGQRIDYCFLSAGLAPTARRAWVDTETAASDHQPLWVELEPGANAA